MGYSATKQKRSQIVNSFLGNEEENLDLLRRGRVATFDPKLEFFVNSARETLVAVVHIPEGEKSGNPVYQITDLKLIGIVEAFAESSGGMVFYYKIPN